MRVNLAVDSRRSDCHLISKLACRAPPSSSYPHFRLCFGVSKTVVYGLRYVRFTSLPKAIADVELNRPVYVTAVEIVRVLHWHRAIIIAEVFTIVNTHGST